MLLRSESRRGAELPDLFTISLPNEGPTPCLPMILIMDNGKTNATGRIEYGSVARHRNPLLCTMGHVAFYLFFRWNIVREPPPEFQQRQQWYNRFLLRGGDRKEKPLSYDTQLEWISKAFEGAGLTSIKKTHAGRAQGAKHAELAGVSESQIRRAGRWNTDSLTNSYLTNIPREFVRGMAGFSPAVQGNYFLPRAQVVPPLSLQEEVWPWVDIWLKWFNSYEGPTPKGSNSTPLSVSTSLLPSGPPSASTPSPNSSRTTTHGPKVMPSAEEDRTDLAAQGFLHLLYELRVIMLQDSVLLRREFPQHPIWADPVFVRDDYKRFAEEVLESLNTCEEPEAVLVRRAMPAVAERINIMEQGMTQTLNEWGGKIYRTMTSLDQRLDGLFNGQVSFVMQDNSRIGGGGEGGRGGGASSCGARAQPISTLPAPSTLALYGYLPYYPLLSSLSS